MMKHILIIWFCLLNMYPYALYAEDANAQQYQDSILKIAQSMPGTLPKLTYISTLLITKLSQPLYIRKRVFRKISFMRIWVLIIWPLAMTNYMMRTVWHIGWINWKNMLLK